MGPEMQLSVRRREELREEGSGENPQDLVVQIIKSTDQCKVNFNYLDLGVK